MYLDVVLLSGYATIYLYHKYIATVYIELELYTQSTVQHLSTLDNKG